MLPSMSATASWPSQPHQEQPCPCRGDDIAFGIKPLLRCLPELVAARPVVLDLEYFLVALALRVVLALPLPGSSSSSTSIPLPLFLGLEAAGAAGPSYCAQLNRSDLSTLTSFAFRCIILHTAANLAIAAAPPSSLFSSSCARASARVKEPAPSRSRS